MKPDCSRISDLPYDMSARAPVRVSGAHFVHSESRSKRRESTIKLPWQQPEVSLGRLFARGHELVTEVLHQTPRGCRRSAAHRFGHCLAPVSSWASCQNARGRMFSLAMAGTGFIRLTALTALTPADAYPLRSFTLATPLASTPIAMEGRSPAYCGAR